MSRLLNVPLRSAATLLIVAFAVLATSCADNTDGLFGQELFEQTCAVCHGKAGQGSVNRPALDAGSNASTLTDDQIRGVISVGPGAMPSFASRLSEEQFDSLIVYLRRLQESTSDDG